MRDPATGSPKRVVFVSARIAGTDGVSLEIGKGTDVLVAIRTIRRTASHPSKESCKEFAFRPSPT